MTDESYADLLIRIRAYDEAQGAYPVEARTDDGRDYRGTLRIDRQALLVAESDPEEYGLALFDALFAGAIGRAYNVATGRAEAAHGGRVRVHLQIDAEAAELHALPWERLYHYHQGQAIPLATSTLTPFSRYIPLEAAETEPLRERPVRLLYVLSNPSNLREEGYAPIDVAQEVNTLLGALGDLRRSQRIEVTVLPGQGGLAPEQRRQLTREGYHVLEGPATLDALLRCLSGQHVLHFLGHGFLQREAGRRGEVTAVLCLEGEDGTLHRVPDHDLVPRLAALDPLPHLVFLAACETAKQLADARQPAGAEHPLVGLAPRLVRAGVPAVVAMQARVPMDVARQLTGDFYRRLLEHGVVDRALNEARNLLFKRDGVDWAIPVLFCRLRTGQLFLPPRPRAGGDVVLRAPPLPDTFAGRRDELERLAASLRQDGGSEVRAAIQGMGGLGKSTLARALGRDLEGDFPGGVLWVEAGRGAQEGRMQEGKEQEAGGPEGGIEAQAAAIVDRLALRLGLDLKDEPQPTARAAIVQNTLSRRGRLLVILDDLWDVDLSRWLLAEALPADRTVLITSRDLAVCRALCEHVERLDVLPEPEALELLANHLGDLAAYEGAARDIIHLLDGLPLALELAARLCDEDAADLPWLLRQLQDKPALDILKLEGREQRDSSVEACLALSYDWLGNDERRRFRALGVFAPAPFDLAALAAVWGDEDLEAAEGAARILVRRGLLARAEEPLIVEGEPPPYPVYAQHSLLRAYALALLRRAGEEAAAADRHASHYQALAGGDWRAGERFWAQVEHGWGWAWVAGPERALDYYHGSRRFLELRGRMQIYIAWVSALLELPDEAAIADRERATLLNNIGSVYDDLGEKQRALEFYDQALPLRRQGGDRRGQAVTLNNIGHVYDAMGEKQRALEFYDQALSLYRQVGDRAGEAAALNNIGAVYDALGEKRRALEFYDQALPLRQQGGDRRGEANTLNNIGGVYSDLGEAQRALELYNQALSLYKQVGDRAGEATALTRIGRVYSGLGEKQRALEFYDQALSLSRQVGNRAGEAAALDSIGELHRSQGAMQLALEFYAQALPLSRQVGNRAGEATTLNNIGLLYDALGDEQRALEFFGQALPLFQQVGDPAGEAATLNNIGSVYDDLGEKQLALELYAQALPLLRQVGDRAGEAATLNNIGELHRSQGAVQLALESYAQALSLSRQVGNRAGEATTLNNIGGVYYALGDKPRALEFLGQALPILRQVGDRWVERVTHFNMAVVYHNLGRLDEAEEQLLQVVALDEALGHSDLEGDRAMLAQVQAARQARGGTP